GRAGVGGDIPPFGSRPARAGGAARVGAAGRSATGAGGERGVGARLARRGRAGQAVVRVGTRVVEAGGTGSGCGRRRGNALVPAGEGPGRAGTGRGAAGVGEDGAEQAVARPACTARRRRRLAADHPTAAGLAIGRIVADRHSTTRHTVPGFGTIGTAARRGGGGRRNSCPGGRFEPGRVGRGWVGIGSTSFAGTFAGTAASDSQDGEELPSLVGSGSRPGA